MRTMMTIMIPIESANRAKRDGTLPGVLEHLASLRPEAAYFFPSSEGRTILLFVDLADPSDIPAAGEPFFAALNARISLTPVMNADDFRKGMAKIH